jgi:hypothetical protein
MELSWMKRSEGGFNFNVRAHAFGRTEFYPYDSWMFNLTLSTPVLNDVNSTNLYAALNPLGFSGWTLREVSFGGANVFRIVRGGYPKWNSVVVTFVLDRASWQTTWVRSIPLILLLILGVSVVIPPVDLPSKATVYTSVIIFIGALLFNVASSISPIRFALSFAEVVFYYLFIAASLYLMSAVIENALFSRESVLNLGTGKRGRMYTSVLRLLLYVFLLGFVCVVPFLYTVSYQELAASYWWVVLPLWETWLVPALCASSGIVVNLIGAALEFRRNRVANPTFF